MEFGAGSLYLSGAILRFYKRWEKRYPVCLSGQASAFISGGQIMLSLRRSSWSLTHRGSDFSFQGSW